MILVCESAPLMPFACSILHIWEDHNGSAFIEWHGAVAAEWDVRSLVLLALKVALNLQLRTNSN